MVADMSFWTTAAFDYFTISHNQGFKVLYRNIVGVLVDSYFLFF
jgi:hypothetical protein